MSLLQLTLFILNFAYYTYISNNALDCINKDAMTPFKRNWTGSSNDMQFNISNTNFNMVYHLTISNGVSWFF